VRYNGRGFFPLWDTTEEFFPLWDTLEKVLLCCGIQRKRLFSDVGYNGRGFFPFRDTMEKNDTMQSDIFKF
jgi:hypothetical protein